MLETWIVSCCCDFDAVHACWVLILSVLTALNSPACILIRR
jgi:hypothetical protein